MLRRAKKGLGDTKGRMNYFNASNRENTYTSMETPERLQQKQERGFDLL